MSFLSSQKCYRFVEFLRGNCLELLNLGSYFSLEFFQYRSKKAWISGYELIRLDLLAREWRLFSKLIGKNWVSYHTWSSNPQPLYRRSNLEAVLLWPPRDPEEVTVSTNRESGSSWIPGLVESSAPSTRLVSQPDPELRCHGDPCQPASGPWLPCSSQQSKLLCHLLRGPLQKWPDQLWSILPGLTTNAINFFLWFCFLKKVFYPSQKTKNALSCT